MNNQPTPEFVRAAMAARELARQVPDDAKRYMVDHIQVYLLYAGDDLMQQEAGCYPCADRLRGLWVSEWPGYPLTAHGAIFVFELANRQAGGDLVQIIRDTLVHEYDHALARDHVLDGLAAARNRGWVSGLESRGCGTCPGWR